MMNGVHSESIMNLLIFELALFLICRILVLLGKNNFAHIGPDTKKKFIKFSPQKLTKLYIKSGPGRVFNLVNGLAATAMRVGAEDVLSMWRRGQTQRLRVEGVARLFGRHAAGFFAGRWCADAIEG